MDILSILGIFLGLLAILGGNFLEGGQLGSLLNGSAMLIVLGGTLGAAMLQTPISVFVRAMRRLPAVFVPPVPESGEVIFQVLEWSHIARREGLLGLEPLAEAEADRFAGKGLQLLVDGTEPEMIREILAIEVDAREQVELQAARVFESMGGYAPTIGIIGAVMGLMQVMQNLTDPSMLGSGIAAAFVATIYGVGLANLIFLPVANKLKAYARTAAHRREMLLEGIASIAEGENPRYIETKLQSYLQ